MMFLGAEYNLTTFFYVFMWQWPDFTVSSQYKVLAIPFCQRSVLKEYSSDVALNLNRAEDFVTDRLKREWFKLKLQRQ